MLMTTSRVGRVGQALKRGGASAFSPSQIPNLALWLDASDTSTISQTGGFVSQWSDKSGNNYHATQAVGANQFSTGITTMDGLNTLFANGSSSFMSLSFLNSLPAGDNTFIALVRQNSAFLTGDKFLFAGYIGGSEAYHIRQSTSVTWFQNGGNMQPSNTSNTDPNIYSMRRSGSSLEGRKNGLLLGQGNVASNQTISSGWVIGRDNASGGRYYFGGEFAEIIIVQRLMTDIEMNQVGNYLAAKWGITWSNI